jgi:hypothetical protein
MGVSCPIARNGNPRNGKSSLIARVLSQMGVNRYGVRVLGVTRLSFIYKKQHTVTRHPIASSGAGEGKGRDRNRAMVYIVKFSKSRN